jgi:hypothetical protein
MFEAPSHPQMLEADKLVKHTEDINKFLQTELTWAQEAYTRHINQTPAASSSLPSWRPGLCRCSTL